MHETWSSCACICANLYAHICISIHLFCKCRCINITFLFGLWSFMSKRFAELGTSDRTLGMASSNISYLSLSTELFAYLPMCIHDLVHQRCWSLPAMLIASSDADRFQRCWSLPAMLIASSDADRFQRCWSLPAMLIAPSDVNRFQRC